MGSGTPKMVLPSFVGTRKRLITAILLTVLSVILLIFLGFGGLVEYILMGLVLVFVIGFVVENHMIGMSASDSGYKAQDSDEEAVSALKDQYTRGEIDETEFDDKMDQLLDNNDKQVEKYNNSEMDKDLE